jgi:hypothetical protein
VSWIIDCAAGCGKQTWAANIADLLNRHLDHDDRFVCGYCAEPGVIAKSHKTQDGSIWSRPLRGAIRLGRPGEPWQPFAFLVGEPDGRTSVQACYYVDLRATGGRLKMGHGPGGPPVLGVWGLVGLVRRLIEIGCLDRAEVLARLGG